MPEEWIKETVGKNKKYLRETLLNYATNRWALNKAFSVGKMSELIRDCAPKSFEEWEKYYFQTAKQNKKNGIKITKEYLVGLGKRLYSDLRTAVKAELASITEPECIDYVHNLVLNRTYEGYLSEVATIYGELQEKLGVTIDRAPDEWDRGYNVDYSIKQKNGVIGLQIKPIASGKSINDYQWEQMHKDAHAKFTKQFHGKVFFVYSKDSGGKKSVANQEVINEIKKEIDRLSS